MVAELLEACLSGFCGSTNLRRMDDGRIICLECGSMWGLRWTFTNCSKEMAIKMALHTKEGQRALAEAMVAPYRGDLNRFSGLDLRDLE